MTSPWLVCPRSLESFARSLRVSEAVEPSWWSQSPSSSYPPTLSSFVHSSPVGILICPSLLASGALAASSDTEIIRYQKLKLPNIKRLKRKKKRKEISGQSCTRTARSNSCCFCFFISLTSICWILKLASNWAFRSFLFCACIHKTEKTFLLSFLTSLIHILIF